MEAWLLGVVGGSLVLSLGCSGVSLWFIAKSGSVHDLSAKQTALRTEVSDLADRLEQWMKRDRVRKVREGKESALEHEMVAPMARTAAEIKAELRRKVFAMGRAGPLKGEPH